jgi:hypothetical protein
VDPWPVLIAAGVTLLIALLVVAVVVSARRERQRREGLRQWAVRHGWTYTERPRVDWISRLPAASAAPWR